MAEDLSRLSDSEVMALYQKSQTAAPDYSRMSDADLMSAYETSKNSPTSGLKRVYVGGEQKPLLERAAETGKGLYNALDVGIAGGVAGLGGAVGDLTDLGALGIEKATGAVNQMLGRPPEPPRQKTPSIFDYIPRARDVQKHIQDTYYGGAEPYQPQGGAEEITKTVGEFAPGALLGPGGVIAKVGQAVIPALTSEVAGRFPGIRGTKAEPYARGGGALIGGGLTAFATRPGATSAVLAGQLPAGLTPQMFQDARTLLQDAAARGVELSVPQALSQVAGRPVLSELQRHLEASPSSAAKMADFFGTQPGNIMRAGKVAAADVSPGQPMAPENVGPAVGRTAFDIARKAEQLRTQAVEPLYKAAATQHVPGPEIQGFIAQLDRAIAADKTGIVGGKLEEIKRLLTETPAQAAVPATRTAKATPAGTIYTTVPGKSAVPAKYLTDIENLDRVRKYVRDKVDLPQIGADAITKEQGKEIFKALDDLEARMVAASKPFEQGKALFQDITERYIRPLMEGPLGKLADKDLTIKNAFKVLFSPDPVAGGDVAIGNAVRAVAGKSPKAASDLARAHIETVLASAAGGKQTTPGPAFGGKFFDQLVGNPQQRANVKAVIEALPNGKARWEGFNRFLDIAEASGTRMPIGSKTAYNQEIREAMGTSGGVTSTAVKAAAKPLQALEPLVAKFNLWRARGQLNELAHILTDPRSLDMLAELSRTSRGSHRAAQLSLALVNYANAVSAHEVKKTGK